MITKHVNSHAVREKTGITANLRVIRLLTTLLTAFCSANLFVVTIIQAGTESMVPDTR